MTIFIQPLSTFDTRSAWTHRCRLKCLTIPTNQSLVLFRRDSDEHSNSDESEKAKQMVKKEVNTNTVYGRFSRNVDIWVSQRVKNKFNLSFFWVGYLRANIGLSRQYHWKLGTLMSVISQVIRQSVLIYYDSVAISMHMPLLTCNSSNHG